MTAIWIGLAFAGGVFAGTSWAVWVGKANRKAQRGPVVGSARWWEEMERRMYR